MGWVFKMSRFRAVVGAGLFAAGLTAAAQPTVACQNHPWAKEPCPAVGDKWRSFLELQDLHPSLAAARSFEAFLEGRDREAERLLTIARGDGPAVASLGGGYRSEEVARLQRRRDGGCVADPYSSTPCLGTAGAWESYAQERGLEQGWESSRGFVSELSRPAAGPAQHATEALSADGDAQEAAARRGDGLIIRIYPVRPDAEGS